MGYREPWVLDCLNRREALLWVDLQEPSDEVLRLGADHLPLRTVHVDISIDDQVHQLVLVLQGHRTRTFRLSGQGFRTCLPVTTVGEEPSLRLAFFSTENPWLRPPLLSLMSISSRVCLFCLPMLPLFLICKKPIPGTWVGIVAASAYLVIKGEVPCEQDIHGHPEAP